MYELDVSPDRIMVSKLLYEITEEELNFAAFSKIHHDVADKAMKNGYAEENITISTCPMPDGYDAFFCGGIYGAKLETDEEYAKRQSQILALHENSKNWKSSHKVSLVSVPDFPLVTQLDCSG